MEFCSDFILHLNQETIVLSRKNQFLQAPPAHIPNKENSALELNLTNHRLFRPQRAGKERMI